MWALFESIPILLYRMLIPTTNKKDMKKLLTLAVLLMMSIGAWAEQTAIVVYFSATGTTAKVAKMLAEKKDAVLWEIQPAEPYTAEDLDWRNEQSRSSVEMRDPEARPTILQCTNIMPYSEVYLGFPIWWGICPRIIDSWLENNVEMLEGKTIYPFATSGGSAIDEAVEYLRTHYPTLNWQDGKLLAKKGQCDHIQVEHTLDW